MAVIVALTEGEPQGGSTEWSPVTAKNHNSLRVQRWRETMKSCILTLEHYYETYPEKVFVEDCLCAGQLRGGHLINRGPRWLLCLQEWEPIIENTKQCMHEEHGNTTQQ